MTSKWYFLLPSNFSQKPWAHKNSVTLSWIWHRKRSIFHPLLRGTFAPNIEQKRGQIISLLGTRNLVSMQNICSGKEAGSPGVKRQFCVKNYFCREKKTSPSPPLKVRLFASSANWFLIHHFGIRSKWIEDVTDTLQIHVASVS